MAPGGIQPPCKSRGSCGGGKHGNLHRVARIARFARLPTPEGVEGQDGRVRTVQECRLSAKCQVSCSRRKFTSTEPANLVCGDWSPKALELDLADGCCVDDVFDLGQHTLADQCLSGRRMRTEPRREVRDRPD